MLPKKEDPNNIARTVERIPYWRRYGTRHHPRTLKLAKLGTGYVRNKTDSKSLTYKVHLFSTLRFWFHPFLQIFKSYNETRRNK
jgi:hypothetical protein